MAYVDLDTIHNPTAGTRPTVAWGDQIRENFQFLHGKPRCRVYNSAAQSIPGGTYTALTFNSERFDTDTMHSTASNTSRITFTTAGTYLVGGNIKWAANSTGIRLARIVLNGATPLFQVGNLNYTTSYGVHQALTTLYSFSAGDYVELVVFHDSGASLNVEVEANISNEFWAIWQAAA